MARTSGKIGKARRGSKPRRHLDETAARVALIAGAFWYELVGFAHKPMAEFVAAALLTVLLALCVRPSPNRPGVVWPVFFFAVLAAAVRIQYAPLPLALLGLFLLRVGKGAKAQLRSPRACSSSRSAYSTR